METALRFVFGILFEILTYRLARAVISITTLGTVRVEPPTLRPAPSNWAGFGRAPDGKLVCSAATATAFGWGLWFLMLLVVVLVWGR